MSPEEAHCEHLCVCVVHPSNWDALLAINRMLRPMSLDGAHILYLQLCFCSASTLLRIIL